MVGLAVGKSALLGPGEPRGCVPLHYNPIKVPVWFPAVNPGDNDYAEGGGSFTSSSRTIGALPQYGFILRLDSRTELLHLKLDLDDHPSVGLLHTG